MLHLYHKSNLAGITRRCHFGTGSVDPFVLHSIQCRNCVNTLFVQHFMYYFGCFLQAIALFVWSQCCFLVIALFFWPQRCSFYHALLFWPQRCLFSSTNGFMIVRLCFLNWYRLFILMTLDMSDIQYLGGQKDLLHQDTTDTIQS